MKVKSINQFNSFDNCKLTKQQRLTLKGGDDGADILVNSGGSISTLNFTG